jgi:hypothetical protein
MEDNTSETHETRYLQGFTFQWMTEHIHDACKTSPGFARWHMCSKLFLVSTYLCGLAEESFLPTSYCYVAYEAHLQNSNDSDWVYLLADLGNLVA